MRRLKPRSLKAVVAACDVSDRIGGWKDDWLMEIARDLYDGFGWEIIGGMIDRVTQCKVVMRRVLELCAGGEQEECLIATLIAQLTLSLPFQAIGPTTCQYDITFTSYRL